MGDFLELQSLFFDVLATFFVLHVILFWGMRSDIATCLIANYGRSAFEGATRPGAVVSLTSRVRTDVMPLFTLK